MTTTPPRPQSAATSTPPRRTPLQDVRLDESGVDTGTASTTDSPSRRSAAEVQRALTYSACFRRYELLIEYRSLAVNGPRGVWVMPTVDELNVWQGVIFIDSGPYHNGVFKFLVDIPRTYPATTDPPTIAFHTELFHPLVHAHTGRVSLRARFPAGEWTRGRDYVVQVLAYVREMFEERTMDGLRLEHCANEEAWKMYTEDRTSFDKLARQCADVSSSDVMLYDNQLSVVAAAEGGNITGSRSRSRLNNISSTAGTASPRPSTPNRGGSNGINAVDPRHQPLRFTPLGNERLQAIKEHALRWNADDIHDLRASTEDGLASAGLAISSSSSLAFRGGSQTDSPALALSFFR